VSPDAVSKAPPATDPPRRRQWAGFLPIVPLREGRILCWACDGEGFAMVSVPCSICRGRTTVPE